MDQAGKIRMAETLLAALGEGQPPQAFAALFSEEASFEIPGDDGVLPWIGHRVGRAAAANFVSSVRELTEPLSFEVDEILPGRTGAVILGSLATRIKATEKVVETAFAIVLAISGDRIVRFQMLEDSFAVSRAARS